MAGKRQCQQPKLPKTSARVRRRITGLVPTHNVDCGATRVVKIAILGGPEKLRKSLMLEARGPVSTLDAGYVRGTGPGRLRDGGQALGSAQIGEL